MKLPWRFYQVHAKEIEVCYHKYGPVFRIIPKEPLREVKLDGIANESITIVQLRCVNEGGVLKVEAFSKADLEVMKEWVDKHKNTAFEDFTWLSTFEYDKITRKRLSK